MELLVIAIAEAIVLLTILKPNHWKSEQKGGHFVKITNSSGQNTQHFSKTKYHWNTKQRAPLEIWNYVIGNILLPSLQQSLPIVDRRFLKWRFHRCCRFHDAASRRLRQEWRFHLQRRRRSQNQGPGHCRQDFRIPVKIKKVLSPIFKVGEFQNQTQGSGTECLKSKQVCIPYSRSRECKNRHRDHANGLFV